MSLSVKIILLVVVGLAVIAGVLWFVFFNQQQDQAIIQTNNAQPTRDSSASLPVNSSGGVNINIGLTNNPAPVPPIGGSSVGQIKTTLTRLAASFSERFGSYSNQSDYANFEDLYDFMTPAMKSWSAEMVAELRARAKGSNDIYFGVTTKALSSNLSNFDEDNGQAEVLVKAQRREATGSTANARIYYQDIVIKLVKEKEIWKVDGAFWQ